MAVRVPHIRTQGFSLLELMVVLAIAGLFVTLTRPMYEAVIPGVKHRTEARQLTAALRESASLSILSGRETRVSIMPEPAGYAVGGGAGVELTSELRVMVGRNDSNAYRVGTGRERAATIVFYPDGSSNGGLIDLQSDDRTYRIAVDWLTGKIELREHHADEI